jgi:hypothetical protein
MAEATRPPERSDLLRLCAELSRLGASYIIIGGLAMNELGLRSTVGRLSYVYVRPEPFEQRIASLGKPLLELPCASGKCMDVPVSNCSALAYFPSQNSVIHNAAPKLRQNR